MLKRLPHLQRQALLALLLAGLGLHLARFAWQLSAQVPAWRCRVSQVISTCLVVAASRHSPWIRTFLQALPGLRRPSAKQLRMLLLAVLILELFLIKPRQAFCCALLASAGLWTFQIRNHFPWARPSRRQLEGCLIAVMVLEVLLRISQRRQLQFIAFAALLLACWQVPRKATDAVLTAASWSFAILGAVFQRLPWRKGSQRYAQRLLLVVLALEACLRAIDRLAPSLFIMWLSALVVRRLKPELPALGSSAIRFLQLSFDAIAALTGLLKLQWQTWCRQADLEEPWQPAAWNAPMDFALAAWHEVPTSNGPWPVLSADDWFLPSDHSVAMHQAISRAYASGHVASSVADITAYSDRSAPAFLPARRRSASPTAVSTAALEVLPRIERATSGPRATSSTVTPVTPVTPLTPVTPVRSSKVLEAKRPAAKAMGEQDAARRGSQRKAIPPLDVDSRPSTKGVKSTLGKIAKAVQDRLRRLRGRSELPGEKASTPVPLEPGAPTAEPETEKVTAEAEDSNKESSVRPEEVVKTAGKRLFADDIQENGKQKKVQTLVPSKRRRLLSAAAASRMLSSHA